MPSASDAAFWSCRAAETRAVAAQMTDPLSRTTMLALAARYERLANFIERDGDVFGRVATTKLGLRDLTALEP